MADSGPEAERLLALARELRDERDPYGVLDPDDEFEVQWLRDGLENGASP
jgi:hypothetical protein